MGIKTYKVEIQEYLSRDVMVEAENEDEALEKIKRCYYDEEIVLYAEDYVETQFIINKDGIANCCP